MIKPAHLCTEHSPYTGPDRRKAEVAQFRRDMDGVLRKTLSAPVCDDMTEAQLLAVKSACILGYAKGLQRGAAMMQRLTEEATA